MANQIVIEGKHYDLEVGLSEWGEWKQKRVFLLRNKEFDIIEAEGPNEIQARVYFDFYEQQKEDYLRDGLPSASPQGPELH